MPDAVKRVMRCGLPNGRELIEIETAAGVVMTVYVSATGRSVRAFRRRGAAASTVELKEAK